MELWFCYVLDAFHSNIRQKVSWEVRSIWSTQWQRFQWFLGFLRGHTGSILIPPPQISPTGTKSVAFLLYQCPKPVASDIVFGFENDGSILATMHLTKAVHTLLQRSKWMLNMFDHYNCLSGLYLTTNVWDLFFGLEWGRCYPQQHYVIVDASIWAWLFSCSNEYKRL